MIPIVNHHYRYILFYSAKVASSALRELFVNLHQDEGYRQGQRQRYHEVNQEFCLEPEQDYSKFYRFLITRNPYSRVISSYLDQYVYSGQSLLEGQPLSERDPADNNLDFRQFLQRLETIDDSERDSHFQTQAYFEPYAEFHGLQDGRLDYIGDVRNLNRGLQSVYAEVFARYPEKSALLQSLLKPSERKRNAIFYSDKSYPDAALLKPAELNDMVSAPRPQDFFRHSEVRELVQSVYAQDFQRFDYSLDDIPQARATDVYAELPADFDWQVYLELSPDLLFDGITTERAVIRHYLEFGRYESIRKYRVEAPQGFDWQRYLEKHPDLSAAGIRDERAAIVHYLGFGVREGREF